MSFLDPDNLYIEGGRNLPNGGFVRNEVMRLQDVAEYRKKHNNTGIYVTAYVYDTPEIESKEAKLYGDFYMDFDKENDLEKARADALTAIWYMTRKFTYDIPVSFFRIYFSGYKGIHLVIPATVFGVVADKNLNEYYKLMAMDVLERIPYKTLDTRIYDRRRLLRIVNSRHQKTGLYKIPLTYNELRNCSIEQIRMKATQMVNLKYETPYEIDRAKQEYKRFVKEWEERFQKKFDNKKRFPSKPLPFTPACIQELIDLGPQIGCRNNTVSVLTSFWKRQGHTEQEIWDRLVAWNKGSLDEKELRRTMQSIFHGEYEYGCSTLSEMATCIGKECPLYKER